MPASDVDAVLSQARALQSAAGSGTMQALLRGKNLGLLCESEGAAEAVLFRRAALELGAHVSYIRPSLSEFSTPGDVQHTARMLGRLYDAVECQGVTPALTRRIGAEAGVPVYDGIALPGHPTARLAALLGSDTSLEDNRRFVLQAVLLDSIA
jgi:ornithine carbamoyltransferase